LNPYDLTIDTDGNIYTANRGSNNVSKITPAGVSSVLGTTGVAPVAVIVDANYNIYTADSNSNTITKITQLILKETTPIGVTNNPTPTFSFSANNPGVITYSGSCTSDTTNAVAGTNTITLNTLTPGSYNDCSIQIDDTIDTSNILELTPFTIQTTPVLNTTKSGGRKRVSAAKVKQLFAQAKGETETETTETTQTITTPLCSISYSRLIKRGTRGNDVTQLQTCMNTLGYNTGVADGIYGPNTYKGIISYQQSKGLAVDGIVGPLTAASLNALLG